MIFFQASKKYFNLPAEPTSIFDSIESTFGISPMSGSDVVLEMFGVAAGATSGCVDVSSEISDCCSSPMTLDPSLTNSSSLKNSSFYCKPFLVLLMA